MNENNLSDFVKKFGSDIYGKSKRIDEGDEGRFRKFSYDVIFKDKFDLDIRWLKADEIKILENLPSQKAIIKDIKENLKTSIKYLDKL